MKGFKKRHLEFCYYLLERNSSVSLFRISRDLGYSINTLKKDLPFIENFLRDKNIKLIKRPRVGIVIEASLEDREAFKKELRDRMKIAQDRNERFIKTALAFILHDKPPTIEELSEILEISTVSAYSYVKKVKTYFQKIGINLRGYPRRGYYLLGDEEKIRNLALELILSYYGNDWLEFWESVVENKDELIREFFGDLDFKKLASLLEGWEERYGFKLDDLEFAKLLLRFAVSLQRIKLGKLIEDKRSLQLGRDLEGELDKVFSEIKESLSITIPRSEYSYLFSFILGLIRNDKQDKDFNKVMGILINFLGNYMYDNYDLLRMLAEHLLRSIQKIRAGERIENPLLEPIKETYREEFNLGSCIVKEINKNLSVKLDENEVGYVTLYLNIIRENLKKKKIAIVCPMGIATSNMLYWKLKQEFPNVEIVEVLSYRDFIKKYVSLNVDLIISTAPLPVNLIPYVIVSPLLTKQEVEVLRKILSV